MKLGVFMWRFMVVVLLLLGTLPQVSAGQEFHATPISLSDQVVNGGTYAGIRLLGALRLPSTVINGAKLCGLSGLAWDEDAELLYAISDGGGLFHLRPEFDDRGFLRDVRLVQAHPLLDEAGNPLREPFNDSEGLAILDGHNGIRDDAKLLVSFELRPRVIVYDSKGRWLGEEKIPALLKDVRNYRDSNKALEAVSVHSRWGVLVGTELPLRNEPAGRVRIFSGDGRFWLYPLGDAPGSSLVAFEALPEGGLLTLERAFVAPILPFVISLRRTEPLLPGMEAPLKVADVAVFNSSQGWHLDNFEGLTHYRDLRFFMVSDDNCIPFQKTLLVHFELLPVSP
jgi:hypothetical protein